MSEISVLERSETRLEQEKPVSGDDILRNVKALKPWLRSRSDSIESARKLPPDVVRKLKDAGVFRMNMPKIWGGPEMTPMQQIEVIEELSRADGSVGWCTMIGADSGLYSGYLEDSVAREMYPRLDMVQAGWVYPIGQAHRVADGYEVTGNWMFGSGCTHCDWLAAGCVVHQGGKPVIAADGKPEWRIVLAKPEEFEILDTWYSTGLCGSGSNDYRCKSLRVPDERTFSFQQPPKRAGTLWRRPDTFLRKMSGIPLGIARDAIDTVTQIASQKVDDGCLYRDLPRIQSAIAQAEGLYGAARSYVLASLEAQWRRLEAEQELTKAERANVWLARTNAFQSARRVVELMYDAIGGSAVYSRKSSLDRHLRDIQTICQHICGQTKGWEGVGALLLDSHAVRIHPML
nr:acyl-CoA dehydrogenase type 2 [uncultured bacterium]